MKKILNFSLCILLALSLTLGNVAPVVNAKKWNREHLGDKSSEKPKHNHGGFNQNDMANTNGYAQYGWYGHIDVSTEAIVTIDGVEYHVAITNLQVSYSDNNEESYITVPMNNTFSEDEARNTLEYRSEKMDYQFNVNTKVKVECDFTVTINGEEKAFRFMKDNYTAADSVCAFKGTNQQGIDLDIKEKIIEEVTATEEPTASPTASPTAEPTASPTAEPTASPTAEPTASPTAEPTASPTAEPTASPTAEPTASPTAEPTASPTAEPTASPTAEPTVKPTATAESTMTPEVEPAGAQEKIVPVTFYILKDGLPQPSEPSRYPAENYVYVGTGSAIKEEVSNNDEKVASNLREFPDLSEILEEGWTVRWYVIKLEWDGWHVDGIKERTTTGPAVTTNPAVTVTTGPAVTETPEEPAPEEPAPEEPAVTTGPAVITNPAVTVTPTAVTGTAMPSAAPTVTPTAVTGTATPTAVATVTPSATTGAATTAPTKKPYSPNGKPVIPQNPISPTTPTTVASQQPGASDIPEGSTNSTETPAGGATSTPATGTDKDDVQEDSDANDVNAGATATPGTNVDIKEDQVPGVAPETSAVPSVEPSVAPTVAPTEKVEATTTPDQKEDITVQDTILPNTPSDSDEETDGNGNATDKDDAVEIEEDNIANSGANADEEDADQDTETEDESDDDYDGEEPTDTEEVEEDEIANSLPQTGGMSANVFYYIGSMICAFGICVLVFIRKKQ